MAAITLATVRGRVQQLGNYENSARFTTAFLNDQINEALFELYELLSNVHEGYFDIETTLSTVASTVGVSLPADFWRLKGVDVRLSANDRWYPLRQISAAERNRYQWQTTGCPRAFRETAGGTRGQLTLYPTPDAVYTLRILYEPTRTALSGDSDSFEDWNGWADYVVHGALLRCDIREQRPLGDRQAVLAAIKDRIAKGATERRSSEPEYLVVHNDGNGWPFGPGNWGAE
jgi:hypothetical protein